MKAIMIEISDKRYFTKILDLPYIIDLAKCFNAKVYVVKSNNKLHLLSLDQLAKAVCDPNFESPNLSNVSIIETLKDKNQTKTAESKLIIDSQNKTKTKTRSRAQILSDSKDIQSKIRELFVSQSKLTLKEIKQHILQHVPVTTSCLSSNFAKVRKELEKDGYKIEKVGLGSYKLCK